MPENYRLNHPRLEHLDRSRLGIDLDFHSQRNGELLVDVADHRAAPGGYPQRSDVILQYFFQCQ